MLRFHAVHASDIRLSEDNTVAEDQDFPGPCIVFSKFPLQIGQEFTVEMMEHSSLVSNS